jgi:hypothetical protein
MNAVIDPRGALAGLPRDKHLGRKFRSNTAG